MGQKDAFTMGDEAQIIMTPPLEKGNGEDKSAKNYGAVLSATDKTVDEVFKTAKTMKKLTGKPIMIILGGD